MRWMCRVMGALCLLVGVVGCSAIDKQELEEERAAAEHNRGVIRGHLGRNTPVGGREDSRPATQRSWTI